MKLSSYYHLLNNCKNKKFRNILYKLLKIFVNVLYPILSKVDDMPTDKTSDIIISLTTFPERINKVWIVIVTIMNQTVKPKYIYLWLSKKQFKDKSILPSSLLALENKGLIIRFCDELGPHKKYFYTMKENPDTTVITIDDDVFYPENVIESLKDTAKKYPNTICCTWGHAITFENNMIDSYKNWKKGIDNYTTPSFLLMPVGCGGVLYPPNLLHENLFNKQEIIKLCLYTDDLWLKAMALLNDIPAVRVEEPAIIYFSIYSTQTKALYKENMDKDKNDISMNNILNLFPSILQKIITDE